MQSSKRIRLPLLVIAVAAATGLAPRDAAAQVNSPDFNGDGYSDLVVGAPREDAAFADVGVVHVLYGSATGVGATGGQLWSQDSPDVRDAEEAGDQFGSAVAHGDWNGDGFSDLAVGAPFEDVGATADAGSVNVLYGTAAGLSAAGNQLWHQNSPGITGAPAAGDRFGSAVGSGDFNGDGFDDLAIGAVGDEVKFQDAFVENAGSVHVLYGSALGLTKTGADWWTQNPLSDSPRVDDFFGWALASGDLNGDGFDELIVGAPFEDTSRRDVGTVFVLTGGASGLVKGTVSQQLYIQGHKNLPDLDCPFQPFPEGCQEIDDNFGFAVSSGDYDADGYDDMAIGVRDEEWLGPSNTGQVHVLYGSPSGPVRVGSDVWNQDQTDVVDQGEGNDRFGYALASGDFDGDGFDDLAIGAVGEALEDSVATEGAGALTVLRGSASRLTTAGQQFWSQDVGTIEDAAELRDGFGRTLNAGDFDGDGWWDLAVGVSNEDLTGLAGLAEDAGAVNLLYGDVGGLSDLGNQLWSQDSPDVGDEVEAADAFGLGLSP